MHMVSAANPERVIPRTVRMAVHERDGMVCQLCGIVVTPRSGKHQPTDLHLDHIIPWAQGGPNTIENLRVACARCNLSRPKPSEIIRGAKVGWERRGKTYYWSKADYRPPRPLPGRCDRYHSVQWMADAFGVPPSEVIARILAGDLYATGGGEPIGVAVPRHLESVIKNREREEAEHRDRLEWLANLEEEVRRERAAKRTPTPKVEADPARVDYWRGIIAARRAATKK